MLLGDGRWASMVSKLLLGLCCSGAQLVPFLLILGISQPPREQLRQLSLPSELICSRVKDEKAESKMRRNSKRHERREPKVG